MTKKIAMLLADESGGLTFVWKQGSQDISISKLMKVAARSTVILMLVEFILI